MQDQLLAVGKTLVGRAGISSQEMVTAPGVEPYRSRAVKPSAPQPRVVGSSALQSSRVLGALPPHYPAPPEAPVLQGDSPEGDFLPSSLVSCQGWEWGGSPHLRQSCRHPSLQPPCPRAWGPRSLIAWVTPASLGGGTIPAAGTHNSGQNMPFPVKKRSCGKQQLMKRSVFCTKREWVKQNLHLGEGIVFVVKSPS